MRLSPNAPLKRPEVGPQLRGSARTVWTFLRGVAFSTNPPTRRFQVSRREIKAGTGIGSLNTIDDAVAVLESFGLLIRHMERGSSDGHTYELLTLDEDPTPNVSAATVANTLRMLADCVERGGPVLSGDKISQWSILAHKASRLLSESE